VTEATLREFRPARAASFIFGVAIAVLVAASFAIYMRSSFLIVAAQLPASFGADANLYYGIVTGDVSERIAKFHPITIWLAVGWMHLMGPVGVAAQLNPQLILMALFALVGALGIVPAAIAFSTVTERRNAFCLAAIYAFALGIWYFSAIPESKIVTATLASLYVALYMRYRDDAQSTKPFFLYALMAIACLNEIASAALILIPFVDALLMGRLRARLAFLATNALIIMASLFALEAIINPHFAQETQTLEGENFLSMFRYYASLGDHSIGSLYAFALNWLFFNIAAPAAATNFVDPLYPGYVGYFAPAFSGYFMRPMSIMLLVPFLALVALVLIDWKTALPDRNRSLLIALSAYSASRAAFFFMFNPAEALLFSPAATLAHLVICAIVLEKSPSLFKFPLLLSFALLLFASNLDFMLP